MSVLGLDYKGKITTYTVTLAAGNNDLLVPASILPKPRPLVIAEILICNSNVAARTIILNRYNGTTDFPLLSGKSIAANDVYNLTFPFELINGWKLRATPSAAGDLTITVTYIDPGYGAATSTG